MALDAAGAMAVSWRRAPQDPGTAAFVTAASSLLEGTLGNRFRETRDEVTFLSPAGVDEAWAGMLTKDRRAEPGNGRAK